MATAPRMNAKSGITVVEVSIVVAILLLLAAIALPAFFQNQHKRRAAQCAMNLDAIAVACRRHAQDKGGFPGTLADLVPDYLGKVPACPSGGTYTLGTPIGDPPTCSVPGHSL
jgi:Tfp pilus assembly protein PilE